MIHLKKKFVKTAIRLARKIRANFLFWSPRGVPRWYDYRVLDPLEGLTKQFFFVGQKISIEGKSWEVAAIFTKSLCLVNSQDGSFLGVEMLGLL